MTCNPIIDITLDIVEADIATVIASFDKIQIHRSTDGETGTYVEITTLATRLTLVTYVTDYQYIDKTGRADYWYKFAYYNSDTDTLDTLSDGFQGVPDPALDICSIEELKTLYLFGVDLTDDTGAPYPNSIFQHYIKSAVDWMETYLGIQITKTRLVEETHDYFRGDYENYIWMELDHFPLYHIEEVKMVLPGEQTVQIFDQDWIQIQRESGQLQLVPGTGTAGSILLGASGSWLPLVYGQNRTIPNVFRVTYQAGFGIPPPSSPVRKHPRYDRVPYKLKEMVGKLASFGPFNIAGDLILGAGIANSSLSIDGLSQSIGTTSSATNSGYGSRLVQYSKELKQELPVMKRYYQGLLLRVA